MIEVTDLPLVNACLNGLSGVFLVAGWLAIRRRRVPVHKAFMLAATGTSTLFLVSYLTYHALHGSTKFTGTGVVRWVYFLILGSHTILATLNLPLIVITLVRAFRGQLDAHRRIARITLPSWIYVSVTGVVVYLMLYQLRFGPG